MPSQTPLYDQDFHAWALETTKLLRQQSWNQVEWEAVIEEIESLGKSQERELASRLLRIRNANAFSNSLFPRCPPCRLS